LFHDDFKVFMDHSISEYNRYFDYQYKVFHELSTTVFEISKCLMLDINKAAVTLTNFVLLKEVPLR